MNLTFGRLRGAFLSFAAVSAAAFLFAAQPAAASSLVAQDGDITVTSTSHARIVNVHRGRAATAYERRFDRVSDDGYDWAPVGYRDVVRVIIEITDRRASGVDADERSQRITLELDPSQLTAAQNAALSNRRVSQRVAPFQLSAMAATSTVRTIDRSRSYLCSGDEFRCEDRLVFEDVEIETTRFSVI